MPKKTKSSVKELTAQIKDGKDLWLFQYSLNGKQKRIHIGFVSQKDAEYDCIFLGRLVDYAKHPQPIDSQTLSWIAEKQQSFRYKLIEHGLIEATEEDEYGNAISVTQLCEKVERQFQEENKHTHKNMKLACDKLIARYQDRKIIDLTKDDIKQLNQWIYSEFAEATASRLSKRFKQIGDIGIGDGLIEINPFRFQDRNTDILQVRSQSNKERQDYVETETVDKMIAVCVRPELRFALFLSRYMAFRIPLETSLWKWHYINFKQKIITVEGKRVKRKRTFRELPIFDNPKLYQFFAELLSFNNCESFIKDSKNMNTEQIKELLLQKGNGYIKTMSSRYDEGEDYVFSDEFRNRTSWSSAIEKLKTKAKISYKKLTHNLRASCESDWIRDFDLVTAAKFAGNTPAVASEHYALIATTQFKKAVGESTTTEEEDIRIISGLVKKYGLKRFQELTVKAVQKDSQTQ